MEEKNQNSQTSLDFNVEKFEPDNESDIQQIIKYCYKKNLPIEIVGDQTKQNIGKKLQCAKTLKMSKYSGVIDYKPEELYITVKAGTPLKIIKDLLKKNNQHLAFEPINFSEIFENNSNEGTIGGTLSCNFSGARRFKVGSARDHILGFKGFNGKGEKIKSGGTVVKNVTGYDLSKLITGSFGTLITLTEITLKVLPLDPDSKTIIISGLPLEHGIAIMGSAISSPNDPSGAVFYPENFRNSFVFNDLTYTGSITAIRVEGSKTSTKQRIENLIDELSLKDKKLAVLDSTQSEIFWEETRSLKVFSKKKSNILRAIVPPSETLNLINRMKIFHPNYFIDWGGSLIWIELDYLSSQKIDQLRQRILEANGYITVIKLKENIKSSSEIFTIDPIKFKISQNIKKSFDPKRIFNPGKMYTGI
ncbi:MAG: 2-hydroxy-acid oxidase [Pelagibacteraceae bacterium]|nr:2-hydroxy-acid oxidase [Pelagibacteraceae bacterium]|tara:strand:- start:771 stop:2027 length:1257 start_codon:yes stop_codon:yes gene_type:complete